MEKNTKKFFINTALIMGTIGLGIYTQNVDWNPTIRMLAHFTGATAVPGYTSFFASNLIKVYEESKTKRIIKKNAKRGIILDDEFSYNVPQKIKERILRMSSIIGGLGYIGFCASWESFQFSSSQVFQLPQYVADTFGPILGMCTIGTVDCAPIYKKVDDITNKIKSKFKNNKENEKVKYKGDLTQQKYELRDVLKDKVVDINQYKMTKEQVYAKESIEKNIDDIQR